jgi:hypothetical protein
MKESLLKLKRKRLKVKKKKFSANSTVRPIGGKQKMSYKN